MQPVTGPTKVEVNEATDGVCDYGDLMKKSDEEITAAIDFYKALGSDIYYGPEEQADGPREQDQ